jgi:outer membrane protein OmpA-like peptidoglycan-associated protein
MSTTIRRIWTLAGLAAGLMLLAGPLQARAATESKAESKPPEVKVPPACINARSAVLRIYCARLYPHHFGVRKGMKVAPPSQMKVAPEMQVAREMRVGPALRPSELAVRETARDVRIELPGDVLFDFDQWTIRPDAEPTLRQVATILQQYPRAKVAIEGHTDAKGADDYNLRLSEQRVASVKAWLVHQGGIDGGAMTTRGWGEMRPVASNTYSDGSDYPEGRQQNRRVEITVRK